MIAELKRHLERVGYEARGGNYRRHTRDSILEDAASAGLRALAELESALERIAREARPSVQRIVQRALPDAYCVRLKDGSGYIVWPGRIQPRGCERPACGYGKTARQAWASVQLEAH